MKRQAFAWLSGQSLFEVLFSIAIAAMLLTGVVSLATTSVRNSTVSRDTSLANKYVEEAAEWLREERDKGWNSFRGRAATSSVWCLKALSWSSPSFSSACGSGDFLPATILIRSVTFTCFATNPPSINCGDTSVNNIDTKVTVAWTDSAGVHETNMVTRLTNWKRE